MADQMPPNSEAPLVERSYDRSEDRVYGSLGPMAAESLAHGLSAANAIEEDDCLEKRR